MIAGLDEVGRGAWAGPIVAGCFMFYRQPTDLILRDSKLTTEKERLRLVNVLFDYGVGSIGEASSEEINDLGLQSAQFLAYNRAIANLAQTPEILLLDGKPWNDCPVRSEAIIDGDAKVATIAAASIIAKAYRDGIMKHIFHSRFPNYNFHLHVGYGTAKHREALEKFGVCPIHRLNYKPIRPFV